MQDCVDGYVGRFHQQFAEDLRHQGPYGAMGGGGWGDPCKASSAFSPLNTGVLPTSTGFNMASTPRGYPFYDPISFQRQSQVGSCNIQYVFIDKRNINLIYTMPPVSGWVRIQDRGFESDLSVPNQELRP